MANLPVSVSFAPSLDTDVSEAFILEPGEDWSLTLSASDADDDLATIDVDFSGSSSDWLIFDQESLTVYVAEDKAGQTLGSFLITIILEDYEGN